MTCLNEDFFLREVTDVARDLLGKRLVRMHAGQRISGIITETEAYRGEDDQACHAHSGKTPRNAVMYGSAGRAYIYFTYGMHWCFNFVTEAEDFPAAVLLRAIQPCEGVEIIAARRSPQPSTHWTDGPGKVCQALGIDRRHNGLDLCSPDSELFIEFGPPISLENVTIGPRVGLNSVPEPWRSMPWRFRLE